jgi:methylated-DNA-[protein]-cysteine S-methyltransferase
MKPDTILVFPSQLGWMAVIAAGTTVKQLTFGHRTAAAAKAAVDRELLAGVIPGGRNSPLARRLRAYASGAADDFRDLRVDPGPLSAFQRRVLDQCRRIPYGSTTSYAGLAAKAGSPGAARAVGNCMAANRIPLIVPCHRVVCSGGRLGSYSAPGGAAMKRRLLTLESGN